MARLNWDRVRAENIVQRRRTVDSDDSVGIARETYASRLQAKGREYFEITSNKVVAEFLGCNPGQASNVRKAVAEKNGWKLRDKKQQSKGDERVYRSPKTENPPVKIKSDPAQLPAKIKEFFIKELDWTLPVECIQQHDVEMVVCLDSVRWNRLIRRSQTEEIAMLVNFLGGKECTITRRSEQQRYETAVARTKAEAVAIKAAATLKPKCIATLRKAHEIASEFDARLAADIHRLILECVLND